MDRYLQFSARCDSEGMFEAYMTAAAMVSCGWYFVGSVILTVAMFLSPANNFLMLLWIWWSFAVVVGFAWICCRVACRKSISKVFALQMHVYVWIVWGFIVYAGFYRGIWSVIHPSGHFSFELRWKGVLFALGGLLALAMIKKMSDVLRAIEERIRLFEAGLLPKTHETAV